MCDKYLKSSISKDHKIEFRYSYSAYTLYKLRFFFWGVNKTSMVDNPRGLLTLLLTQLLLLKPLQLFLEPFDQLVVGPC